MVTETAATAPARSGRRQAPPATNAPGQIPEVDPVKAKRGWGWGAGAVAAVIAGGLIGVWAFTAMQNTEQVFVVSTDLDRGATITAQDLTTIAVAPNQQLNAFTRDQLDDLVGMVTAVPLPKGSLVTEEAVASTLVVPEGMAMIGIALKPSQLPGVTLTAGDKIVITPIAQQGVQSPVAADDIEATVANSSQPDPTTGLVIVNAFVPQSAASDVASRAAAGTVTIYLKPVN